LCYSFDDKRERYVQAGNQLQKPGFIGQKLKRKKRVRRERRVEMISDSININGLQILKPLVADANWR
jgi:hypothetical protein